MHDMLAFCLEKLSASLTFSSARLHKYNNAQSSSAPLQALHTYH